MANQRFKSQVLKALLILQILTCVSANKNTQSQAILAVKAAIDSAQNLHFRASLLKNWTRNQPGVSHTQKAALGDCVNSQSQALDLLHNAYKDMILWRKHPSEDQVGDVQTWVSAALTYETTCSDGVHHYFKNKRQLKMQDFRTKLDTTQQILSNALAYIAALHSKPPL